jgi:hypothetical protein
MRTTLDIDDDILEAAKELGKSQGKTAGKVLSDIARGALAPPGPSRKPTLKDGWYVLPARGGVVTSELVERLLEQADLEDAGLADE